jgi:hypothetical protein
MGEHPCVVSLVIELYDSKQRALGLDDEGQWKFFSKGHPLLLKVSFNNAVTLEDYRSKKPLILLANQGTSFWGHSASGSSLSLYSDPEKRECCLETRDN